MFEHFASAAAFSGVISYSQTGSIGIGLKTAATTLATEYAWAETGTELDKVGANVAERSLTHGMVGGTLNVVEGGNFKNGFLSAAVSQAMSGPISQIDSQGQGWAPIFARGMASGVVGGTVAAATGGNFENGMMTSAFAQMFNDDDLVDKVQDFIDGPAEEEIENDANALGPEAGIAVKGGEEAAVGLAKAVDALEEDAAVAASTPVGRLGNEVYVSPGTNAPAAINGLEYSGHALDQMQARGLTPSVIEDTISNGIPSTGRSGAMVYRTDQAKVVISSSGRVVTVMPQ